MEKNKNVPKLRFPEFTGEWEESKIKDHTLSSAFGPRFSSSLYDSAGKIAILRTTDMDIDGNLDLTSGTITLSNANATISVNGNVTGTGSQTVSSVGRLLMTGSGTTLSNTVSYDNVEISSAGNVSLTGNTTFYDFNEISALELKKFKIMGQEAKYSKVDTDLNFVDSGLSGNFKNPYDTDIDELYVVFGNNIFSTGQVKKGDTREVHHFRVLEELKSV